MNLGNMLKQIENKVRKLREIFIEYLEFLNQSTTNQVNITELNDYLEYVKERRNNFENWTTNINKENATHLYGLVNSINRYFSEFNWYRDMEFYNKATVYRDQMAIISSEIYEYFKNIV